MDDELMEVLVERLARMLGLEEPDEDTQLLLYDEAQSAVDTTLLYLNRDRLDRRMLSPVAELAALYYRRDTREEQELSACAYAEGQVSQRLEYLTDKDYLGGVEDILRSLARYRQVAC